jgi:hypothetical protein
MGGRNVSTGMTFGGDYMVARLFSRHSCFMLFVRFSVRLDLFSIRFAFACLVMALFVLRALVSIDSTQ